MKKLINIIAKTYIKYGLKIFYKKWQVSGLENIPKDKPVIFAINHQSAFLDPLIVTCSTNLLPYYLARAEVFKTSFAAKMLNFIRIMPIYRFRDGLQNVKKNDAIIEACSSILSKNEKLVLFPEGNHSDLWYLRSLQRGLSRIAFKTEQLSGFNINLQIVPVGIHYENPKSFRSRILVKFDKPFSVNKFKDDFLENERKALDILKEEVHKVMKPLIINIPKDDYDNISKQYIEKRCYRKDMEEQLKCDQELIEALSQNKEIEQKNDQKSVNPISYLFALPSWIVNIIPYKLTLWFIDKKIKDKVFVPSIKYLSGITLVPIYYLLLSGIIGIATTNQMYFWISIVAIPIVSYLGFDGLKAMMGRKS